MESSISACILMYDNLTASAAVNWSHGRSKGCISKWCWDQRRRAQVQSLGLNGPKISWFEWYFRRTREDADGQFAMAILKHIIWSSSLLFLIFSFLLVAERCVYMMKFMQATVWVYFWSWCLWLWLQSSIAVAALRNTLSLCHVAHQQTRNWKVNGAYIQYEAGRGCKQVISHVHLIQTSKTLA